LTYQQIAERLFIANSTVQTHMKNLYGKLNARNKTQALHNAFGGSN
jgi:DNA-binding NarL/FixJ family response regulator